jgi:hypothetical protein
VPVLERSAIFLRSFIRRLFFRTGVSCHYAPRPGPCYVPLRDGYAGMQSDSPGFHSASEMTKTRIRPPPTMFTRCQYNNREKYAFPPFPPSRGGLGTPRPREPPVSLARVGGVEVWTSRGHIKTGDYALWPSTPV